MKLLAAFFLCVAAAAAQTVSDVQNEASLARTNNTVALTVTATQGDGSACKVVKQAGASIVATLSCTSGDGKTVINSGTLRAGASSTPQVSMLMLGDVLCLLAINPTPAAVTLGSLGTVPINGLAWSCSTNIETAGVVTGQTAPVNGSVVWP